MKVGQGFTDYPITTARIAWRLKGLTWEDVQGAFESHEPKSNVMDMEGGPLLIFSNSHVSMQTMQVSPGSRKGSKSCLHVRSGTQARGRLVSLRSLVLVSPKYATWEALHPSR